MRAVVFATTILACGTAQAECIVADPSPTPLNVRTAPYGRIIGALANGEPVLMIDASADRQGSPWVYIADETGAAVHPLQRATLPLADAQAPVMGSVYASQQKENRNENENPCLRLYRRRDGVVWSRARLPVRNISRRKRRLCPAP
jgi:hypothetical protein